MSKENENREHAFTAIEAAEKSKSNNKAWHWAEIAIKAAEKSNVPHARSLVLKERRPNLSKLKLALTAEDTIVVTRHQNAVAWLEEKGMITKPYSVLEHVDNPAQIQGKNVIGVLPLWLAHHAVTISSIQFKSLPKEWRSMDLTLEQMEQAGACLEVYVVHRIS